MRPPVVSQLHCLNDHEVLKLGGRDVLHDGGAQHGQVDQEHIHLELGLEASLVLLPSLV